LIVVICYYSLVIGGSARSSPGAEKLGIGTDPKTIGKGWASKIDNK
jgi:hypothetical protein